MDHKNESVSVFSIYPKMYNFLMKLDKQNELTRGRFRDNLACECKSRIHFPNHFHAPNPESRKTNSTNSNPLKIMKKTIHHHSIAAASLALLAFGTTDLQATVYNWVGGTSSDWETAGNWGTGGKPTSGATGAHRLNIGSTGTAATRPLIYTSSQGTTTFNPPADRGLVIYRASTMEIQGGTFTTAGSSEDAVGLNGETATLTIAGGIYNANSATRGLTVGFSAKGIFNINSGAANITSLHMSTAGTGTNDSTLNLNGGTLSVENITAGIGANFTTTVLLNGGTLIARQNDTAFISSDLDNLWVGTGGAKIDTAGYNVTIAKAMTPDGASVGGLTLNDTAVTKGILTITGSNTYTGATIITAGTLALANGSSIAQSSSITVSENATLDVSAVSGGWTLGSGKTLDGKGTVNGNATINGNLKPGTSPGVLSFDDNLILGATASTTIEIGGTTRGTQYDGIDVGGALTYGGALTFDMLTTFGVGSYTFNLFDTFTSESGDFSSVALGGSYSGALTFDGSNLWTRSSGSETWTFTQSTGDLSLTVAIPEPGAALLGSLGILFLLRRRRC